jgi:hypothetical protein
LAGAFLLLEVLAAVFFLVVFFLAGLIFCDSRSRLSEAS